MTVGKSQQNEAVGFDHKTGLYIALFSQAHKLLEHLLSAM